MEVEMTSLISVKDDCIEALETCIQNCRELVETYKGNEQMNTCIKIGELCINACLDCIVACKSVQAERGQFVQVYVEISKACISNFENHVQVEFQKSILACGVDH